MEEPNTLSLLKQLFSCDSSLDNTGLTPGTTHS